MLKIRRLLPARALRILMILSLSVCAALGQGSQMTARDLFLGLLGALNSKEEAKLREFLDKHTVSNTPVEQRLSRLKELADMGAPFKVIRPSPEAEDSVRALVEDGNGEKLGFVMDVRKGPEPKMLALRIGPPDMLDAPAPKEYTGWQDLAALGASIRADAQSPAIGIAVIRAGKLEQAVSGMREVNGSDAVAPDDPWSIGSIGKPICSTIIGRLIEMGKLRWDLTLGEALADLPMKPGHKGTTIEQILHHRGGIPEDLNFQRERVMRILAGATEPVKTRENYARDILSRDPIAQPGERFAYSNAGYALLGIIAERTMKQPYEVLVRQLVFEPLSLSHSYTGTDELPEPRPSGHVAGPQGLEQRNFSGPLEILVAPAGGGLHMSVGDLARFGAAHLKGLRGEDGLLKASTVRRLHEGLPERAGDQRLYACGWGIENVPGVETMHTHNGSNGTFRAQLSIFPKANLVVAAFINRGGESEPAPPLQAVLAVAKRHALNAGK